MTETTKQTNIAEAVKVRLSDEGKTTHRAARVVVTATVDGEGIALSVDHTGRIVLYRGPAGGEINSGRIVYSEYTKPGDRRGEVEEATIPAAGDPFTAAKPEPTHADVLRYMAGEIEEREREEESELIEERQS